MASLVTIFGGSGFVGRYTVRAFAKAGWRVRVAVRHPNLANYLLPMGHVGQIQIAKTNVASADAVASAVTGADVVVNLVGILSQRGGHQKFAELHADAAGEIAQAAKAAGAGSVIHLSAIGANEDSPSAYQRTKAQGEARVREAFAGAIVLRPSIVFGPEDKFFNRFAWLARMSPVLPLFGGGATKFQPVFVGDVADAILKCASDASTRGKTYELGGPTVYSFKELMALILRETGRERKRLLLPLPFFVGTLKSYFLQLLPDPLLTPDQMRMLKVDNVTREGALTLADLGITPDCTEAILPSYLWRFRPKGQYENFVAERVSGSPRVR
jgi:NADH dehydrogenase